MGLMVVVYEIMLVEYMYHYDNACRLMIGTVSSYRNHMHYSANVTAT